MKEKLKQLFGLFGAFAVVGVTTFGGGYAMLPALQREVVEKRRWATEEEVMDWYAIGQCTPGVIAVNTATFVGQKQAGIWGGIFATLGVVFPSLVIIMIIAAFIQNFAHLPAVQNAFAGIRVCVCVLILNAVVKLWKKSVVDWKTFLIFLLVFAGSVFLNISPVLYVRPRSPASSSRNWRRVRHDLSAPVLGVFQDRPVFRRRRPRHAPVYL